MRETGAVVAIRRACASALALALALPALAEKMQTVAPVKPAPGNERRVALVIGNSAYKEAPLRNPANDARAISKALSETGFTVTVIEDATQVGMRRAIRNFGDELAKAAVGIFYYAGHGMQVRGANYLIPVNADIEREDEVGDQGIDANLVLAKMDSAKKSLNIMILDACRNNPFARSFRSSARGLAQMDAPSGTLISFATAPGSVASDGSGVNGLYTEHLLKAIRQPGLPIEQVFKQVRIGVTKATGDQQIPWESSSLKGDFYFTPPDPGASPAASQAALQKAVADVTKAADERVAREREDMQRRMEKMIQEALAAQRAMLEAERRAAGASAPAPAAPAPVAAAPAPPPVVSVAPSAARPAAPIQMASAAPAPVAAAASAAPAHAMGDRYRYIGTDAFRSDKKHEYVVEVLGATAAGLIETTSHEGGPPKQWVYTSTPTLVGGAGAMVVFSPLVMGTQSLQVGQTWRDVATERVGRCSGCGVEAKVSGFEKVTTQAGTFDAYRVDVLVTVPQGWGTRGEYNFWYAPQLKRIVKYKSRSYGAGAGFLPLSFDAELVAYQFAGQAAVGAMPEAVAGSSQEEAMLVATTKPVAGVAVAGAAAPKVGDRWEYVDIDMVSGKKFKRAVEVTQIASGTVRDRITGDELEAVAAVHAPGAYVVDAGMLQFSPYLLAFGDVPAGKRLGDADVFRMPLCSGVSFCTVSARAVGLEKVAVPAGTFEAMRIEVNIAVAPPSRMRVEFTYWLAPAARRMVKMNMQVHGGGTVSGTALNPRQIELTGLQLK